MKVLAKSILMSFLYFYFICVCVCVHNTYVQTESQLPVSTAAPACVVSDTALVVMHSMAGEILSHDTTAPPGGVSVHESSAGKQKSSMISYTTSIDATAASISASVHELISLAFCMPRVEAFKCLQYNKNTIVQTFQ